MADIAKITLKGESEAKNFIDEALRGDIAYEELSTTVSKTGGYVAGDHLIYLGQYYEVVADIAQGGTIVTSGAGQNVEEREVGDEIKKNKTQVLGVICDVETSPATAAHSAGDQFYYDGALVEATSAIAIGDTIVVSPDTGYNVKVADKVVAQIQTLTNKVDDISDEIADMNNVLGAKNLLPYPYTVSTKQMGGITWTVNADGSVSASGTATGRSYLELLSTSTKWKIPKGTYILSQSGMPANVTIESGYYSGDSYYAIGPVLPGTLPEVKFEVTDILATKVFTLFIDIPATNVGKTFNFTVYPMIRLASITDDTYEPYAKTNRELTEKTASIESDISAINTQLSQLDFDGAGAHNSIYRGKYLGAEVTAEQYAHIADGTFKDMYIGDYWTINGVNYRIGHFDYWLRTGDTECTTHHILIVSDPRLSVGKMNSTNTTAGGYVGSDLKTGANDNTALATAKNIITTAFGSAHILTHREFFANAVANGKPSAGAWYDSDIDLMNENMVYGTNIFSPHSDGSAIPSAFTIDKTQIKLFAERPDLITTRGHWQLRDVVSNTTFASVGTQGDAGYSYASNSIGIRPAFGLRA
jgi:hypothetical protein